jgi:hypothetical protein
VNRNAKNMIGRALDDRRRDRQRFEQAEIVHSRKVRSRVQSVRPTEPLNCRRPSCCSLHLRFLCAKGLIPRIFFALSDMLTPDE